jgi:predicted RNA-binding protein YlxR (DUF448 family)
VTGRHQPVRTCVGCRGTGPSEALVRFVLVDGVVVPGAARPGRGAWLHARPDCAEAAERRRAWVRAFRTAGPVDASAVRSAVSAPL